MEKKHLLKQRAGGILLHPTSLPSGFGIGDLGPSAYSFIDFLEVSKQKLWQILPLGPTGYGDSPYQCFSAFAGNPILISPELLKGDGYLEKRDLADYRQTDSMRIDFGQVIKQKHTLFAKSFLNFSEQINNQNNEDYNVFIQDNQYWLDDYSLFMALKEKFELNSWNQWPDNFKQKKQILITENHISSRIEYYKFLQFIFFKQWLSLKKYANQKGIAIIGDLPIFVAADSSDVWAKPELFDLDQKGNPIHIAGVPPDYFSETGQLWGNPLYSWQFMKNNDYEWWKKRIAFLLKIYDIIRIDHFRGFAAFWQVPGNESTAINGKWIKGPGADFFQAMKKHFDFLPFIAEDLGYITDDVYELRDQFDFPGMSVLHFAFIGGEYRAKNYLPHNLKSNSVLYTGTHDNDTTFGWYKTLNRADRDYLHNYLNTSEENVVWALIQLAYASVANSVIIPMQDILLLDSDARMNNPGIEHGNWQFRFTDNMLEEKISLKLIHLAELYER